MLVVEENTRSGQNVGSAIEATDPDGHRLTYTLEGPGKDFVQHHQRWADTDEIAPSTTRRGTKYSLTVKVNDGQRKNNSVAGEVRDHRR